MMIYFWDIVHGDLKILVIDIQLLTLIIFKNGPSIINARSYITFILYFVNSFLTTVIPSINFIIIKKLYSFSRSNFK